MSSRDYRILIKIVDEINVITILIHSYDLESFMNDEKTKRAVAMTLINVGELVKNLTLELRQSYPSIPWKSISGMRDLAAHKYQTLNMGDVWVTITNDIPELKDQLELILHMFR